MHVYVCMYNYFVVFLSGNMHGQARPRAVHIQVQLMHIQGETYEGPQGPGTMLLKSGTILEIQGPLRPMHTL